MPAQIGSAVLLQYGASVPQQSGAAILLDYSAQGTGVVDTKVRSVVVGRWSPSASAMRPLNSPAPATKPTEQRRAAPWVAARKTEAATGAKWPTPINADDRRGALWGIFGGKLAEDKTAPWASAGRRDDERASRWGKYAKDLGDDQRSKWVGTKALDDQRAGPWGGFLIRKRKQIPYVRLAGNAANFGVVGGGVDCAYFPVGNYTPPSGDALQFAFGVGSYTPPFMPESDPFVVPARNAANLRYTPQFEDVLDDLGAPVFIKRNVDTVRLNPWGVPVKLDDDTKVVWVKYSRPMSPGWGIVVPVNPGGNENDALIIVPVRSIYMQVNSQSLVVTASNEAIEASSLSLQIDADSWVWGWSATVPAGYLDLLQTTQGSAVEVTATINGTPFSLYVERITRSREFGKSSLNIGGRGRAAWLAAPYHSVGTRTNSIAMTAQQLMADALTINGVSNGWTIDWKLTDWNVPAGAWSHTGTPMDACLTIAQAAGGYIQADRTANILHVLPRYALAPWEWNTMIPDISLPENVCVTEGIEWVDKPEYNAVYVSGGAGGVLGHVKRTGTDGGKVAQMIVDPLITHTDVARQRGLAVLSDTGRIKNITLSLPVLTETGIIVPGKTVSYSESGKTHLGIVRAVNVSSDFPRVRQSITVESHVV